jgi:hypothetical protein
MKAASLLMLAALLFLLAACSSPTVQITPASGAPYSVPVDCGPIAAEVAQCEAIVAAAARIISASPGSRAVVSDGIAPNSSTVTLIDPNGAAQAADVIFNPLGEYTGVNPRRSP